MDFNNFIKPSNRQDDQKDIEKQRKLENAIRNERTKYRWFRRLRRQNDQNDVERQRLLENKIRNERTKYRWFRRLRRASKELQPDLAFSTNVPSSSPSKRILFNEIGIYILEIYKCL